MPVHRLCYARSVAGPDRVKGQSVMRSIALSYRDVMHVDGVMELYMYLPMPMQYAIDSSL